MSQSRALFPGPRLEAFFRAILRSEPRLDDEAVDRLARDCARPVARMWVTDLPEETRRPSPRRNAETEAATAAAPASPEPSRQAPEPDDIPWAQDLAAGLESTLQDMAPWPEEPGEAEGAAATPQFDPYAFSVVAVLKREGAGGVQARLAAITSTKDLLALAEAQHLALPEGLTSPSDIQTAILTSAEARLAGRRAAAS